MCAWVTFVALFGRFRYMFVIFFLFLCIKSRCLCSLEECEHLHRASIVDTNCVRGFILCIVAFNLSPSPRCHPLSAADARRHEDKQSVAGYCERGKPMQSDIVADRLRLIRAISLQTNVELCARA